METTLLKERVQNGIEYLNKNVPSWKDKIDLDTLKVNTCSTCVIGQIVGNYLKCKIIGLEPFSRTTSMLGFDNWYYDLNNYDQLQQEWERQLKEIL